MEVTGLVFTVQCLTNTAINDLSQKVCAALDNESIEENLRTICFCGHFFKWHIPTSTPQTASDACSQNFQVSTLYRVEGGITDISFRKCCTVLLRHPNLQEIMNIASLSQGLLPRIVNKKAHFFFHYPLDNKKTLTPFYCLYTYEPEHTYESLSFAELV